MVAWYNRQLTDEVKAEPHVVGSLDIGQPLECRAGVCGMPQAVGADRAGLTGTTT
jgi:hypothetical protein